MMGLVLNNKYKLEYLNIVLLTISMLIVQYVFPINIVFVLFISAYMVYMYYKKQNVLYLLPLLVFSFQHGDDSLSIYTIKFGGISLFYLLTFIFLLIGVLKKNKIKKYQFHLFLALIVFITYSVVLGNVFETKFFFKDIFYLLVTLVFVYIFERNENINFDTTFLGYSTGFFIAKLFVFYTGIGLEAMQYSSTAVQYNALFDSFEVFLVLYSLYTIFIYKNKFYKYIAIVNIGLFFWGVYILQYMQGSTIVLLLVASFIVIVRKPVLLFITSASIFIIITISTISLNVNKDSVIYYKLENVISLFSIVLDDSFTIYDVPRSPQVRIIELSNVMNSNPFNVVFGQGLGGYVTETKYKYGKYLNEDDYSKYEIENHKYFDLHTINQLLLKHGLLGVFVFLYILFKYRDKDNQVFMEVSVLYLIFSWGYTIKPYILLALFICEIKNSRKKRLLQNRDVKVLNEVKSFN